MVQLIPDIEIDAWVIQLMRDWLDFAYSATEATRAFRAARATRATKAIIYN